MNVVFCNCQGLRPKRKELQNYLQENQTDILALNETFLKPKFKFHLSGYDIYRNHPVKRVCITMGLFSTVGDILSTVWDVQ